MTWSNSFNRSWFICFIIKLWVPDCWKWKPLFKQRPPFYCLFWFESLVWWVNEGLWVQLSVVMRPLPHSFTLGHNESATPAFGFLASPAIGSRRKLGLCSLSTEGPVTLELGSMNPIRGRGERTGWCLLPGQSPTFCHGPTEPSSPLGHGFVVLPRWNWARVAGTQRA